MPVQIPFNFISECSDSTLKQFIVNCLNQIDMLKKSIAEQTNELCMWHGRMEAAQEFAEWRAKEIRPEPQRVERVNAA